MIVKHKERKVFTSGDMESSEMSMDADGIKFACHFLRNKIYSDKILAVCREYIANALDEHMKFQIDRPIEITIEEGDNPQFIVRDFAQGLNDHDVRHIFGYYFRSTKNKSRDAIGGFGIGSKSGHAYTSQFTVESNFEGTKRVYICALNGQDALSTAQMYEISSCPTDETGIKIIVPIKKQDIFTFKKRIETLLAFTPKSKAITNFNRAIVQFNKHSIDTPDGKIEWGVPEGYEGIYVVLGVVPYKVDSNQFTNAPSFPVVIFMSPSDIDISLSRENLEYTSKTIKNLSGVLGKIESKYFEEIADDFLKTKNVQEWTQLWSKFNWSHTNEIRKKLSLKIKPTDTRLHFLFQQNLLSSSCRWRCSFKSVGFNYKSELSWAKSLSDIPKKILIYPDGKRHKQQAMFLAEKHQGTILCLSESDFDLILKEKIDHIDGEGVKKQQRNSYYHALIDYYRLFETDIFDELIVNVEDVEVPQEEKENFRKRYTKKDIFYFGRARADHFLWDEIEEHLDNYVFACRVGATNNITINGEIVKFDNAKFKLSILFPKKKLLMCRPELFKRVQKEDVIIIDDIWEEKYKITKQDVQRLIVQFIKNNYRHYCGDPFKVLGIKHKRFNWVYEHFHAAGYLGDKERFADEKKVEIAVKVAKRSANRILTMQKELLDNSAILDTLFKAAKHIEVPIEKIKEELK